jgi:hypothetical protein
VRGNSAHEATASHVLTRLVGRRPAARALDSKTQALTLQQMDTDYAVQVIRWHLEGLVSSR